MRPRPSPHDSIAITRAKQALNRISSRLLSPRARYVLARALAPSRRQITLMMQQRLRAENGIRCTPSSPLTRERGPITVGYHDDGFTGPARVFCDFPTYPRVFPRNKCGVQRDGSPYFGSMFLAVTKLREKFLAILGHYPASACPKFPIGWQSPAFWNFARQPIPTRYPHLSATMPVAGRMR